MNYPGIMLRDAIARENPLQVVGVINPLCARLAEQVGFQALYLSGGGVANAKLALPDLGMISLNDVLDEVRNITAACSLPLLVDLDTGFGNALTIRRAFRLVSRAGAAGAHIEDQQNFKRCGHREGKSIVSTQHMVARIKAALDGREHDSFVVMARTDALAIEGLEKAIERALAYEAAGADAIFAEAFTSLEQYKRLCEALTIPVLANMTEFGKTPYFNVQEFGYAGVAMVLYPLSAFRAMNAAALRVYFTIRRDGTQESVLNMMQSRQDLYHCIRYGAYEQELDNYLQLMDSADDRK